MLKTNSSQVPAWSCGQCRHLMVAGPEVGPCPLCPGFFTLSPQRLFAQGVLGVLCLWNLLELPPAAPWPISPLFLIRLLCSCLSFQGPAQSQGFLMASGGSELFPGPGHPPCVCACSTGSCLLLRVLILGVGNQVLG